jgi:hypothetical protein
MTPAAALFPDLPAAGERLRARLLASSAGGDLATLAPDELEAALMASAADAERALRVFFGAVEILPDDGDQATRDALDEAGTRWAEDPGYDWSPEFFQGERWGFLRLRHRPVSAVVSLRFVFPLPGSTVFQVPADWIRLDKRAGDINLVPGTASFTAPLAAYAMQLMSGGRAIPRMIQARYRAGLANPTADYPELVPLVLQMAMAQLLKGVLLPGTESVSMDGLSQSRTLAMADYDKDIETRLERLRQAIHGVTMICL